MIASVVGLATSLIDGYDNGDAETYSPAINPIHRHGKKGRRAAYRCSCPDCIKRQPARAVGAALERAAVFNQSDRPRCTGCGAMRALVGRLCWKCTPTPKGTP